MRLYLAGPMSGIEDHNFPAFHAAAAELRAAGYSVFNPAETGLVDDWKWVDYLRYDVPFVARAEGVAFLSGYHNSAGARIEHRLALDLQIPCRLVRGWLDQAKDALPVEQAEKRPPCRWFEGFLDEGGFAIRRSMAMRADALERAVRLAYDFAVAPDGVAQRRYYTSTVEAQLVSADEVARHVGLLRA